MPIHLKQFLILGVVHKWIEGSNIEYGKIENCKIDTNLTSKIWRRVTSKKNDGFGISKLAKFYLQII